MEQHDVVDGARLEMIESARRREQASLFKKMDDEYIEGLEAVEESATQDLAGIIAAARGDLGID